MRWNPKVRERVADERHSGRGMEVYIINTVVASYKAGSSSRQVVRICCCPVRLHKTITKWTSKNKYGRSEDCTDLFQS